MNAFRLDLTSHPRQSRPKLNHIVDVHHTDTTNTKRIFRITVNQTRGREREREQHRIYVAVVAKFTLFSFFLKEIWCKYVKITQFQLEFNSNNLIYSSNQMGIYLFLVCDRFPITERLDKPTI